MVTAGEGQGGGPGAPLLRGSRRRHCRGRAFCRFGDRFALDDLRMQLPRLGHGRHAQRLGQGIAATLVGAQRPITVALTVMVGHQVAVDAFPHRIPGQNLLTGGHRLVERAEVGTAAGQLTQAVQVRFAQPFSGPDGPLLVQIFLQVVAVVEILGRAEGGDGRPPRFPLDPVVPAGQRLPEGVDVHPAIVAGLEEVTAGAGENVVRAAGTF